MSKYLKVLDVWEGNLEMNEDAFAAGNVVGLIIRLNNMSGGHHVDTMFLKQWGESQRFNPAPYFVYNPWVSGLANYNWLLSNCPKCPTVFIDTEVTMPNYPPATYGAEFDYFINLCVAKWHTVIYAGQGSLDMLTPWPKIEYWWPQWSYPLYPGPLTPKKAVTWEELDALLDKLPWPPVNSRYCDGTIRLHQCSGDRFIVPGTTRIIDVSIWPGTKEEYATWIGWPGTPTPPPTYPPTDSQRIARLEVQALAHGWTL